MTNNYKDIFILMYENTLTEYVNKIRKEKYVEMTKNTKRFIKQRNNRV